MKNILILGAGMSTNSLITYLLENAVQNDWHITVGDINEKMAKRKVNGHPMVYPKFSTLTMIWKAGGQLPRLMWLSLCFLHGCIIWLPRSALTYVSQCLQHHMQRMK